MAHSGIHCGDLLDQPGGPGDIEGGVAEDHGFTARQSRRLKAPFAALERTIDCIDGKNGPLFFHQHHAGRSDEREIDAPFEGLLLPSRLVTRV